MSRPHLEHVAPNDIPDLRDDVVSVYRETFTLPPYNESEADIESFAEKLGRHAEREGFRMVSAYRGERLVGFAYGFDGGKSGWTRSIIEPLLTESEVEEWHRWKTPRRTHSRSSAPHRRPLRHRKSRSGDEFIPEARVANHSRGFPVHRGGAGVRSDGDRASVKGGVAYPELRVFIHS